MKLVYFCNLLPICKLYKSYLNHLLGWCCEPDKIRFKLLFVWILDYVYRNMSGVNSVKYRW